jgi:hypothetical protein
MLGGCCIGGEAGVTAVTVLLESALRVPRRYRSGEGLTGASSIDIDKSEMEGSVRGIIGELSVVDFLASPIAISSFVPNTGATRDRLEEPDVDTVESDEDDA